MKYEQTINLRTQIPGLIQLMSGLQTNSSWSGVKLFTADLYQCSCVKPLVQPAASAVRLKNLAQGSVIGSPFSSFTESGKFCFPLFIIYFSVSTFPFHWLWFRQKEQLKDFVIFCLARCHIYVRHMLQVPNAACLIVRWKVTPWFMWNQRGQAVLLRLQVRLSV